MSEANRTTLTDKEVLELFHEATPSARREVWHMVTDAQPEFKPKGNHRDIPKLIAEYESKYEDSTRIYTSELEHLRKRSYDLWDLMTNCIAFGYMLGRRSEKNSRRKRNRKAS